MFSENTSSRESQSALLPSEKTAFFFFLLLKRTRFPGKRESILGSVATRYRWRTANKMFVESMERVFAPRQLFLSLPLSLCLFLHLFFLFLPREETLKHAPNRLMFKRARAFSWQQHLQPSIYVVFQSPEGRRISFRSTWKNQARFELVGKVGATEIL